MPALSHTDRAPQSPDAPLALGALSRGRLWAVFVFWAALMIGSGVAFYGFSTDEAAKGYFGGDFSAFYTAATAAADGDGAALYDDAGFAARMKALLPERGEYALTWQYPPSYFFFILPFAFAPFLLALGLWWAAGAGAYFAVMRHHIRDRMILFAVMTGPPAFIALITGQNGFFTAALIALAAFDPKGRPLAAGIAAGLLTVKPHLGLLLPIAYLAIGAWRAIFIAALTGAMMAFASAILFGVDAWAAFFSAVFEASNRIETNALPLAKMATPMSAAVFAGLPQSAAAVIAAGCALGCAAFTWRVWTRIKAHDLRLAALGPCIFLASPYGFHYELIILALPVAIIAMRGARDGWLRYEPYLIALAYMLPLMFSLLTDLSYGVSSGFAIVLITAALVLPRLLQEDPALLGEGLRPKQPSSRT